MRGTVVNRHGHFSIVIDEGKDPVTGKRRQRWIATKGSKPEAEAQLNEMMRDLQHGTFVKPAKIMVRDYVNHWLDTYVKHNLSSSTNQNYRLITRKHILPTLGNMVLSELKAQMIQNLENQKLESGLSHSSVIKLHNILHGSLQQALIAGKILNNPCDGVKRPKEQYKEINIMSMDTIHQLLDKAKTDQYYRPYYPLWLTSIHTGLRRGEDMGIKWGEVNLLDLTISINHSLYYQDVPDENGERIALKAPKTKSSRRVISITPSNAVVLREHYQKTNEDRKSLGLPLLTDDDFVFCHLNGKPYLPNTITHAWGAFVRKCGMPGVRLHDCRHAYATHLIANGVPAAIIAKQLGHSSTRMTDRYTHISQEMQRKAAATFEAVFKSTSGQNQRMPPNVVE